MSDNSTGEPANVEPLQSERALFSRMLTEWLQVYYGKYALIKGDELIGVFDTDMTAVAEGARLFGAEPFLVRAVVPDDQQPSAPAYTLGILRANIASTIWENISGA